MFIFLIGCWALSVTISLFGHPEVNFWTSLIHQKVKLAERLRSEKTDPLIFIGGGSSTSFSIHPDVLSEQTGLPAINMGGSGALGYRYLVNLAFSKAEAGDIVILHMAPESLTQIRQPTKALGIRVALRQSHLPLAEGNDFLSPSPLDLGDILLALRPGTKFLGTLTAKFLSGRPPYAYSLNNYQNGILTIPNGGPTKDIEEFSPASKKFTEQTAHTLREISNYANSRKIRVFFTLPWECFKREACPAMRSEHQEYLKQVERYMPVLRDPKLGAHDRPEDFLDTGFHMTLEAGKERSIRLAQSLRKVIDLEPQKK